MRNPTLLAIALGALALTNGFSAIAAPPSVGAASDHVVVQRQEQQLVALATIQVKVLAEPQKCGESQFVKVQLTNNTSKGWLGDVQLLTQGIKIKTTVTLPAKGSSGDTGVVTVSSPVKLDCTKPLPVQEVSAFPSGVPDKPVYKKNLKAQTLAGAIGFAAPPTTDTRVWLRRTMLELSCGQASKGIASLQNFGSAPQTATVKLAFGGQPSQDLTITVPPGNNAPATLTIPTVDCDQTIGSLDYNFTTGIPRSGKLSIDTVTYAP